ncbi:MAG: amino acid adenylation domain-containing protein [Pseudomonadota bacterium]
MGEVGALGRVSEMTPEQKRKALATLLKAKSVEKALYPLSDEQRSLWFQQSLDVTNTAFNIPLNYIIHLQVDEGAVRKSIQDIVDRQEVLRTQIVSSGGEVLQKVKDKQKVAIKVTTLKVPEGADWRDEVLNYSDQRARQPFDLKNGPLFRVELVHVHDALSVLMLTVHHVIFDGWSTGVFLRDFADRYVRHAEGSCVPFEPLKYRYRDFVKGERTALTEQQKQQQIDYWLSRLDGAPVALTLPADYSREKRSSTAGATYELAVTKTLAGRLENLGKTHGATFFMTMLSSFYVLLARLSGQYDIVLGVATANRKHEESWSLLGQFSKVLPMRARFDQRGSFVSVLKQVTRECFTDLENDGVSITSIVEAVNPERDPSMNALFQAGFDFQNTPWPSDKVKQSVSLLNGDNSSAKIDLNLAVTKIDNKLLLTFEYCAGLFNPSTIESFATAYQHLLEQIVVRPDLPVDELPLLGIARREQISAVSDGPPISNLQQRPLVDIITRRAKDYPERTALVDAASSASLTYAQLCQRAHGLAVELERQGVQPHERVGLFFEQSMEYVVSVLAVWIAGASYVPLDRKLPASRVKFILDDAAIETILSCQQGQRLWKQEALPGRVLCVGDPSPSDHTGGAEAAAPVGPAKASVTLQDTAYTIYTSGTTGQPKGVVVSHGAISHYAQGAAQTFGFTPQDRVLQFASVSFDTSCEEIFPCLLSGAALVVRDQAMVSTVSTFLTRVAELSLTAINLPTAYWGEVVSSLEEDEQLALPSAVRLVVIGGEAAPLPLVKAWLRRFKSSVRLLNTYGPTETTVSVTTSELSALGVELDALHQVPIGWPNPGVRVAVVDEHYELQPLGVVGELVVSGPTLAEGYRDSPALTREKFVVAPSASNAPVFYRTGDYGRLRADLGIEYKGRIDGQVKLRGYRIETREIEAVLLRHAQVRKACVLLRDDLEIEQLVAYVAVRKSARVDGFELVNWIGQHCPAYMVPSQCVVIDEMPLNTSGKVDVQKLYAQPLQQLEGEVGAQPSTATEEILAGIWCGLLDQRCLDVHADFFRLGGHSLLITKMLSRIAKALGVELPLASVFQAPTIASLSRLIDDARASACGEPTVSLPILKREDQSARAPLSFAQRRLWFIDRLRGESLQYQIPQAFTLSGPFDEEVAESCFRHIVERHEILRSRIIDDGSSGECYQEVRPGDGFRLHRVDLQHLAGDALEARVGEIVADNASRPFRLSDEAPFRVSALRLAQDQVVLVSNIHHIAADGMSLDILWSEFVEAYEAYRRDGAMALPLPEVQYADYSYWQHRMLDEDTATVQLAYWERQLDELPQVHGLPLDRPRPDVQTVNGANLEVVVDAQTCEKLRTLAVDKSVTLYMLLYGAFSLLLARYANDGDVVLGTPVANRNSKELEKLIGLFVNTLVLRLSCNGDSTLEDFLRSVRETVLDAQSHQDVPFERVVEHLNPRRSAQYSPLCQIMFGLNVQQQSIGKFADIDVSPYEGVGEKGATAQFDLSLDAKDDGQLLRLSFEYNSDLFDQSTVAAMARHYLNILKAMLENPQTLADIQMIDDQERQEILSHLTGPAVPEPQAVPRQFAAVASRQLDKPALVEGRRSITYGELSHRATSLAVQLRRIGVDVGDVVAVTASPSIDWAVAVLGIFNSGATYLPIASDLPAARIEQMLRDAGAQLLLLGDDDGEISTKLAIGRETVASLCEAGAGARESSETVEFAAPKLSDNAYILYTSGSTGAPKGVVVDHRALAMHIDGCISRYGIKEVDRTLAFSSISFDASLEQLIGTLLGGATGVIYDKARLTQGARDVLEFLQSEQVTVADLPPAVLHQAVREDAGSDAAAHQLVADSSLRMVIVGGEAIPPALAAYWKTHRFECQLVNAYGPTEGVITAVSGTLDGEVTLGQVMPGRYGLILNQDGQLLPFGAVGQLYLGGACVAKGYLNKPELTDERFVRNPLCPGSADTVYATGDRVKLTRDGKLHFLGRADEQVQLNGIRIEPGEIEHCLLQAPEVTGVAVVVGDFSRGLAPDHQRRELIAFIAGDALSEIGDLKKHFHARIEGSLPSYMMPTHWVALDRVPLLASGKVDRSRLPFERIDTSRTEWVAPRSDVEKRLAELWARILGQDVGSIGLDCDFFMLGGHSLLSMRLVGEVRGEFDVDFQVVDVFRHSTLGAMAHALGSRRGERRAPLLQVRDRSESVPLPLSFTQLRLWFVDQLEEDSTKYNMPAAFRITGSLNIAAAQGAFRRMVDRHEVLRTTYQRVDKPQSAVPGELVEQRIEDARVFSLAITDLSSTPEPLQRDALQQRVNEQWEQRFDLQGQLPIVAEVVVLGDRDYALLVNMHHIAVDGWSWSIVQQEFASEYNAQVRGTVSGIQTPVIQYADFALWQRDWMASGSLQAQSRYWEQQLADLPTVHNLPLDRPRSELREFCGASHRVSLDPELTASVHAYARAHQLTPFMLIHAAFSLVLSKYSGEREVVVGTPVANRAHRELDALIGCFVNMLVLRVHIDPDARIVDYLEQVKHLNIEALDNQELPFELLVEKLNPKRGTQLTPLFQILINMEIAGDSPGPSLDGLEFSPIESETTKTKYDLSLNIVDGHGLTFDFEYLAEIFDAQTITRMGAHLCALLRELVEADHEELSSLTMLAPAEEHALTAQLNPAAGAYTSTHTLVSLFDRQAELSPNDVAVRDAKSELTYLRLQRRADLLAAALRDRGLQHGDRVAVLLSRDSNMLACLLGILKCGAVYVPLSLDATRSRIEMVLEDSDARFVVFSQELASSVEGAAQRKALCLEELLDSRTPAAPTQYCSSPDDLAYFIYTSGSTGTPKAVAITHGNAAAMIAWAGETYSAQELSGVLASTQLTFDLSVFELFVPISHGGATRIVDSPLALMTGTWNDLSLINTVPSVGRALVERQAVPTSVSTVNLAGEPLPRKLLGDLLAVEGVTRVCNLYGPSEDTTYSTHASFTEAVEGTVPIGRPVKFSQAYVVDVFNQLAPPGASGELLLAGAGLAQGYFNRRQLTREKFVHLPVGRLPVQRLYRTGDRVRWNRDGQLEYLGRFDDQIKFNGFRIEVGEIQSHLEQVDWIDTVVVQKVRLGEVSGVAGEKEEGGEEEAQYALVAYVKVIDLALRDASELCDQLKGYLSERLPSYMLPNRIVLLTEFPLTANGKIDRSALPLPLIEGNEGQLAPRTAAERFVLKVWQSVLGTSRPIGVMDDFFALGGHSLLAVSVISSLMEKLQIDVPLAAVFAHPTIGGLTVALAEAAGGVERLTLMVETYERIAALSADEIAQELTARRHEDAVLVTAGGDTHGA